MTPLAPVTAKAEPLEALETESKQLVDRAQDYTDRSSVAAGSSAMTSDVHCEYVEACLGEVRHPTVILIRDVERYLCGRAASMNK